MTETVCDRKAQALPSLSPLHPYLAIAELIAARRFHEAREQTLFLGYSNLFSKQALTGKLIDSTFVIIPVFINREND